ncbi:MAG: pitrilysin family protein [bacterium]
MLKIAFILMFFVSCVYASEVREERLDNGLHVLLKRVDGMPLVSVWSWIHAGSANECPGITGVAHWCEHMNFKGTEKYGREELKNLIEREGGIWNGYTWLDQTTYYETLSSHALDLALDIESQRLSSSLFRPADVQSERSVIISELQMGENDPENLLDIETTAAAFKAHPYHWPTIGWQGDVEGMDRDDLYGFYKRYYSPSNATLVVVGDFDEEETLRKIREKFGKIPAGEAAARLHTKEPKQLGERRVKVERGGGAAYLQFLYHTPTIDSEDFFPLLALDTMLGGAESINIYGVDWRGQASKSSRLYRGLVETKLAAKAGSLFLPTKYPLAFCIYATAADGVSLEKLEDGMKRLLDEVKQGSISDEEFQKVINQLRARFVYDTEGVTGQAHLLGFFDTLGDYKFGQSFISKIREIKKEAIVAVAKKYFSDANRTVGWYLPAAKPAKGSVEPPGKSGVGKVAAYKPRPAIQLAERERLSIIPPWLKKVDGERAAKPASKAAKSKKKTVETRGDGSPRIKLNAVRKTLPNGMTLIVRENHSSPSVVAYVDVTAGSSYDPAGAAGVSNFTANMLDRGSAGMSGALIADTLDSSGTELQIACNRDRAAIVARMLSEKLPLVMEVLAQMIEEPIFPESEVDKLKLQIVTALEEASHDTRQVAIDKVYERIYPSGHPYRHKVEGTLKSIHALSRDDVVRFYASHYGPRAVTIVLSGDVSVKEAEDLTRKFFGKWKTGPQVKKLTVLPPPLPLETNWNKVKIPDKTQVDIAVGLRGIARDNPDYYALHLMNTILGRFGMGGRLGRTIREQQGLAYYVTSAFIPYRYVGPFIVKAGVNPKNVDKAVKAIREGVLAMRDDGVTSKELKESKDFIIKSLPRRLETNFAVASALADIQFYNLGLDYFERYPDLINAVSVKDVLRVAREYLYPNNLSIILAGPVSQTY